MNLIYNLAVGYSAGMALASGTTGGTIAAGIIIAVTVYSIFSTGKFYNV